ncbi:MAG: metallophosphoesterase [Proteobacteria bacterium]|nr:metallophosphoesterase [Pseudomonadota bacterium]
MNHNPLPLMKNRKTIKHFLWTAGLALLGLIAAPGFWNTFDLKVTDVIIENQALSQALFGKTVVHLTDLHMTHPGIREKEVLKRLEALKPDLVFLTGDYIAWEGAVQEALAFLNRINPPMGAYAVIGDYDMSRSRVACLFCHEKGSKNPTQAHSVHMLNNTMMRIQSGKTGFYLYGMSEGDQDDEIIQKHLSAIPQEEGLIVLSHNPMRFNLLDDHRETFMMAGDTHGGQIPLPALVWRILGYEKNRWYNAGLFKQGKKQMYVSRGIGWSHLPLRLFCPPEIVVYHFLPIERDGQ